MNFLDHISDPKNPTDRPKPSSGLGVVALLAVLLGILGFMIVAPNTSEKARDQKAVANEQLFKFDPQVGGSKDNNTTDEPEATEPEQPAPAPAPTPAPPQNEPEPPAPTPSPTPTTDKSFTIRVANGSDTDGLAGKYADSLKSAGFNVITINNALSKSDQTKLFYLKGKKSEADLVAQQLGSPQVQLEEFEEGDISDAADVVIVLGKDREQ